MEAHWQTTHALHGPTAPPTWAYRGDLHEVAGVRGGKARTCWAIATAAKARGCTGLATAGSRQSPQINIVAQIARHLGMASMAYCPEGELGPELQLAQAAGCNIVQVRAGYNSVIRARARQHAEEHPEYAHIPFGMECPEALHSADHGMATLPARYTHGGTNRIVVPVGSGMTLAAILTHMEGMPAHRRPHLRAVQVGADPTLRLTRWAPPFWQAWANVVHARSPYNYHQPAPPELVHALGYPLDPIYEAKCIPYLNPGDALWIVGVRQTHQQEEAA